MRKQKAFGYAIGAATVALVISIGYTANGMAPAPSTTTTVVSTPETTTTTIVVPETTTTTTTLPDPVGEAEAIYLSLEWKPCSQWFRTAAQAGWPLDLIPDVLDEMYSESRCLPLGPPSAYPKYWSGERTDAWGEDYADLWNHSDWGLMQINGFTHKDFVSQLYGEMDAMVDPLKNLEFAWKLYSDLDERGRCGFKPWSRPCVD